MIDSDRFEGNIRGDRRHPANHRFGARIQLLRIAEYALDSNGFGDEAAMVRQVIEDLVSEHNNNPMFRGDNGKESAIFCKR